MSTIRIEPVSLSGLSELNVAVPFDMVFRFFELFRLYLKRYEKTEHPDPVAKRIVEILGFGMLIKVSGQSLKQATSNGMLHEKGPRIYYGRFSVGTLDRFYYTTGPYLDKSGNVWNAFIAFSPSEYKQITEMVKQAMMERYL
jgi:hypothetical protein